VELSNIDSTCGGATWGSARPGGIGDSNGFTPGNRACSVHVQPFQKRSVLGRVVSSYHPLGVFTRVFLPSPEAHMGVPQWRAGAEDRVNPTDPGLPATPPVSIGEVSQNLSPKALNGQAKRPNCGRFGSQG
jgi:hypothetical protein